MKIPTKKQRMEWRREQGSGMQSAIGEYTPPEFWELLDAVDFLEDKIKQLLVLTTDLDKHPEWYKGPCRCKSCIDTEET